MAGCVALEASSGVSKAAPLGWRMAVTGVDMFGRLSGTFSPVPYATEKECLADGERVRAHFASDFPQIQIECYPNKLNQSEAGRPS